MSFRELMNKHNLLGGRYSVPPTCPPSPPPTASARTTSSSESTSPSSARRSVSPPLKRKRSNVMASNVVLPKNNRIHTNTGFMLLEERNPETNEKEVSPSQNDLGEALVRFSRQRRMAERLKDPIVVKTQNRKQKTNLNAFKSKFLTLKKKVSALQMEVGTEPDFLLLVKNNLQDPSVAKPSKMAGKYMCYGSGEISELFFKSGIKYNASEMYKLANNFDYAEEPVSEVTENRECNIDAREPGDKRTNRPKKVKKTTKRQTLSTRPTTSAANYGPRKVFTPGSGFHMSEEKEAPVSRNHLRKHLKMIVE